jgi:predicted PurR-regulated permease PerM|tara:strand:+ start:628 stop:1848 length:1221 start_codon:yes stop_codon:yes gene_type:complete
MASIYKRRTCWYLQWSDSKGRHRKSLGKISKKAAEVSLKRKEYELVPIPLIQDKTQKGNVLIIALLAISAIAIMWLFIPFLPSLFLSLLICITTYSGFIKLSQRCSLWLAAIIMTFGVTVLLILPLSYVLMVSGIKVSGLIIEIQDDFQISNIRRILDQITLGLPLSDSMREYLDSTLRNNIEGIVITLKDFTIMVLKSVATLSSQFIFFIIITIFSLYYFYIDGASIIKKIRAVSPLDRELIDLLLKQFSGLSVTLVGSVVLISLIQGLVFSFGVLMIGFPALFFGVAMALAGFIPALGGLFVWLPLSIYLFAIGETSSAFIILFFGAILAGTLIDNFLRPVIIKKLSSLMNNQNALNHTLITVLSTLAGIIQFGILGLFIGPIIAAMTITIFDIYKIKYIEPKN